MSNPNSNNKENYENDSDNDDPLLTDITQLALQSPNLNTYSTLFHNSGNVNVNVSHGTDRFYATTTTTTTNNSNNNINNVNTNSNSGGGNSTGTEEESDTDDILIHGFSRLNVISDHDVTDDVINNIVTHENNINTNTNNIISNNNNNAVLSPSGIFGVGRAMRSGGGGGGNGLYMPRTRRLAHSGTHTKERQTSILTHSDSLPVAPPCAINTSIMNSTSGGLGRLPTQFGTTLNINTTATTRAGAGAGARPASGGSSPLGLGGTAATVTTTTATATATTPSIRQRLSSQQGTPTIGCIGNNNNNNNNNNRAPGLSASPAFPLYGTQKSPQLQHNKGGGMSPYVSSPVPQTPPASGPCFLLGDTRNNTINGMSTRGVYGGITQQDTFSLYSGQQQQQHQYHQQPFSPLQPFSFSSSSYVRTPQPQRGGVSAVQTPQLHSCFGAVPPPLSPTTFGTVPRFGGIINTNNNNNNNSNNNSNINSNNNNNNNRYRPYGGQSVPPPQRAYISSPVTPLSSPVLRDSPGPEEAGECLRCALGHVAELAQDQEHSRAMQKCIEKAPLDVVSAVLEEVCASVLDLADDMFGNYVVQKLLERGSQAEAERLAGRLRGHVLRFTLNKYGCRVVQKALECVGEELRETLAGELAGNIVKCVFSQDGNHVIQVSLLTLAPRGAQFIVEAFCGHVYECAVHPYGCRVIQLILDKSPVEQTRIIVPELVDNLIPLVRDQYGNYVVQCVVTNDKDPEARAAVAAGFAGSCVALAQNKFASNVLEVCLKHCTLHDKLCIAREIVMAPPPPMSQVPPIVTLAENQYGNYVVQSVLDVVTQDKDLYALAITKLRPFIQFMKRSQYSRRIAAKVEMISNRL